MTQLESMQFLPYKTRGFADAYSIKKLLGKGAFGDVWLCTERMTGPVEDVATVRRTKTSGTHKGGRRTSSGNQSRKEIKDEADRPSRKRGAPRPLYAVKVMLKSNLNTKVKQDDVRQEIAIMKAVAGQHEGVVRLHEVLENDTAVYLVMEYCAGGDLFDMLCAHGKLPEASARYLFRQMASALAFCHDHGILHRDIKPENILFDRHADYLFSEAAATGSLPPVRAKFADFGLSIVLGDGGTASGYTGSKYYTAPEMVRGLRYEQKADVWSLGILLYAMLTGRLPFAGKSEDDKEGIKRAILQAKLHLDTVSWIGVSEQAKDLVRRLLQADPNKRLHADEILLHPWLQENFQGSTRVGPDFGPMHRSTQTKGYEGEVGSQQRRQQQPSHAAGRPLQVACESMDGGSDLSSCVSYDNATDASLDSPQPVGHPTCSTPDRASGPRMGVASAPREGLSRLGQSCVGAPVSGTPTARSKSARKAAGPVEKLLQWGTRWHGVAC